MQTGKEERVSEFCKHGEIRGKTATEITAELDAVLGTNSPSFKTVFN